MKNETANHTPGPWTTGGTTVTSADGRTLVAKIVRGPYLDIDTVGAANATLIAAAPDMLAALKLVDRINVALTDAGLFDQLAGDLHPDTINEACDAVRAAIAKTEDGTTPLVSDDRREHVMSWSIARAHTILALVDTEDAQDWCSYVEQHAKDALEAWGAIAAAEGR